MSSCPSPIPRVSDNVVAVARQGDASLRQIAKDFGISESCLSNWQPGPVPALPRPRDPCPRTRPQPDRRPTVPGQSASWLGRGPVDVDSVPPRTRPTTPTHGALVNDPRLPRRPAPRPRLMASQRCRRSTPRHPWAHPGCAARRERLPRTSSGHLVAQPVSHPLKRGHRTFTDPTRGVTVAYSSILPVGLPSNQLAGLLDRATHPLPRLIIALIAIHALTPHDLRHLHRGDLDLATGQLTVRRRAQPPP